MEPRSRGPVPWDRTGFTPVSRGVPCPGLTASQSPQVCCSCLQQAVAHGAALPRSTRDLLCTFPGSSGKGPTLHSCILCPMFPNTQLPRKCLQPSWRVAPLSPLSLDWLRHLHLHQSCGEPAAQNILVRISHFFQQTPLTYFKIILCFTEAETWRQIFAHMAFIHRNSYF